MADVKISGLPASTTPLAGTEVLPVVQSGTTKQVSVANLTAGRAVSAASLNASGAGSFGDKLTVNSSLAGDVIANIVNTNSGGYGLRVAGGANGSGYIASFNDYNSALAMLISGSGGVSIGNFTDPGATNLSVTGNAISAKVLVNGTSNPDTAYFVINGDNLVNATFSTNISGAFNQLIFRNPNGVVGTIQTNGSLTSYNVTSDPRLKDITGTIDADSAKSFVMGLNPVTGIWKSNGAAFSGFLTSDYQKQDPEAVIGEPNAVDAEGNPVYQQMEYGSMAWCANMTALVQSLVNRLDAANIK
jgi:hypothetical protein